MFTGVDASNNATSGYLGAGFAFGKGLYDPGWHVRAVGGSDLAKTFDGEAGYSARSPRLPISRAVAFS